MSLRAGCAERFTTAGVLVLNLVSSPGTGQDGVSRADSSRTACEAVRGAALVGDLETDNDARRLAASGAPVRQINTHGICHLEAEMMSKHLDGWESRRS